MLQTVKNLASAARWRLKPVRWAGKAVGNIGYLPRRGAYRVTALPTEPGGALVAEMDARGYAKLDRKLDVPAIDLTALAGLAQGKSFVDVSDRYPDQIAAVFASVVNDPEISALIMRYFDGEPWLWNVALNYSDVSKGLTDSQLWHFDYGDVRQLHVLVYFSDVDERAGPFSFIEKPLSERVPRHPLLIERFNDADIAPFGLEADRDRTRLCGARGDVFFNDPGVLLHQGARCETPRLVMFISFTTPAPMSKGGSAVASQATRRRLVAARQPGRKASALPDRMLGA